MQREPVTADQKVAGDTLGYIEFLDPALEQIIADDAHIEILATGFTWSEGPVWITDGEHLLFSDVPENTIYRWSRAEGLSTWLSPSGDTGYATGGREGSNGLLLDHQGRLILCQHGDRRVARLDAPLSQPAPAFVTLVDQFDGKRFNSPNDAAYHSSGALYFTDPPYGLADPSNTELGFQGVYRLSPDGVSLIIRDLSRPNGIALSIDEKTLYVANSDPGRAIWMAYDLREDGTVGTGRLLFDATGFLPERAGLPDGLKVDDDGIIYATGPGGVLIFDPGGRHLGNIRLPIAAANVAFGDDGSALYITADMYLLRVALLSKGRVGPPRAGLP